MSAGHREDEYDRRPELKEFDETKAGVKGLLDAGIHVVPRIFHHHPENLIGLRPPPPPSARIPIIDLSGHDSLRRAEIVGLIGDASRELGFFQIVNHGIPDEVIASTIAAVKAFHEQAAADKAPLYGRSGDVFYYCNVDLFRSKAASWRDSLAVRPGQMPPDWGPLPAVCQKELKEWDHRVRAVAEGLSELLCEGLGLEKEKLKAKRCLDGRSMLAHYYPRCPQPELTLGIPSHTDPSVVTVLLQDRLGGLQVKHGDHWLEVEPSPGALVVNIGDLLQIMSNDEYKSVEHRVVANSHQQPRISVVVFFSPGNDNDSVYYGPFPELVSKGKTSQYRNFTLTEFWKSFWSNAIGSTLDKFRI